MGYFLWTEGKTPEEWNNDHNISPDQVEAVIAGSAWLAWQSKRTESPQQMTNPAIKNRRER
jgi:hypothetical protein